jgi:Na+-driven multidrug efflux pump
MATLVDNSVRRTLFNMAFPMLAGTFALNAYNLTDTWFVSKLGTVPLAAMGFTLPIVMILRCLVHGAGTGITTLVSHAIGRKDYDTAARLTTHGMAFSIYLTLFITVIGYLTIKPTFALLGADEETLPLIYDYMEIWYFGSVFMTIPMIGNGGQIHDAGDASESCARPDFHLRLFRRSRHGDSRRGHRDHPCAGDIGAVAMETSYRET